MGRDQCGGREALRVCLFEELSDEVSSGSLGASELVLAGLMWKVRCDRTHLQDLIESTALTHYEGFRSKQVSACQQRAGR